MNRIATVTMTLAFLAWGGPAAAQVTAGFGAHAGVSVPTGGYGDVANTGFSGGVDLMVPVIATMPSFSWYTSADVAGHSVSDDVTGGSGGYLLIPVMTGARFDVDGLGMIRPFVTGQIGGLVSRGPDIGTASSSTGLDFGFALGGGLNLTQNLYAGAKWFSAAGDVAFDYNGVERTHPVSYVDIYLGFGVR